MAGIPTVTEVLRWLDDLARAGYSTEARHKASQWATPILMAAGTPLVTEPAALSEALFVLGAADLLGDFENYVYGEADFAAARTSLASGAEA